MPQTISRLLPTRRPLPAILLLATFALAACAPGGTTHIYYDVVKGFFEKPADAVVTDEMLAARPFAYIEARLGDGPQSVLVLGWQDDGEDKWVSAGNEMLVLRHGRVVRTLGLPIDRLHTASAEVDPLAQAASGASLDGKEWRSTLDWAGVHGAGFQARSEFRDHGIEAVALRAGQTLQLRRVEELVTLRPAGLEYSNWFYLDGDGTVLKSRQILHPDLDPLTLVVVRPPAEAAPVPSQASVPAEDEADNTRVRLTLADGRRILLPPGPRRLSEVLLSSGNSSEIWWPAARLYRTDAARQHEARASRDALIAELEALAAKAEQRGRSARAASLRDRLESLPPTPPGEPLVTVLDPDRLRLTPALDVLLPPGEYLLVAPTRPETLTLAGLVEHPGERGFVPGRNIAAYLATEPRTPGADRDHVWLLQPDGSAEPSPVAHWNREHALPLPGATFLVGLSSRGWGRPVEALNRELATLYAAQPMAPMADALRAAEVTR